MIAFVFLVPQLAWPEGDRVKHVSENINGVSEAVAATGQAASGLLGEADRLAHQAETLQSEVHQFLASVRGLTRISAVRAARPIRQHVPSATKTSCNAGYSHGCRALHRANSGMRSENSNPIFKTRYSSIYS